MSELKVIKIELNNHGKPIASIQGTTSYYGISPKDAFYKKSEADAVIADLEMKLATAQLALRYNEPEALYSNLDTMNRLSNERNVVAKRERHQAYKRCLAMAELAVKDDYAPWNMKWHKRWLELAEMFK